MSIINDIDWKSLIIGAAVTSGIIILAARTGNDWLMLFSSIGLLYVGYAAKNIKYGTVLGAIAATPIIYLISIGTFGEFTGFFLTTAGQICIILLILFIGAFVGFVGAWAKRSREKAKVEYEKKQNIGKNKKKKKN